MPTQTTEQKKPTSEQSGAASPTSEGVPWYDDPEENPFVPADLGAAPQAQKDPDAREGHVSTGVSELWKICSYLDTRVVLLSYQWVGWKERGAPPPSFLVEELDDDNLMTGRRAIVPYTQLVPTGEVFDAKFDDEIPF